MDPSTARIKMWNLAGPLVERFHPYRRLHQVNEMFTRNMHPRVNVERQIGGGLLVVLLPSLLPMGIGLASYSLAKKVAHSNQH